MDAFAISSPFSPFSILLTSTVPRVLRHHKGDDGPLATSRVCLRCIPRRKSFPNTDTVPKRLLAALVKSDYVFQLGSDGCRFHCHIFLSNFRHHGFFELVTRFAS